MKKLIIFGATGTIGKQLLKQAIAAGTPVTAFVRNSKKIEINSKMVSIVEGDVLNPADVERAIAGHESVVVALGNGRKGNIRSQGTANIITAMKNSGVKRLVCQSTLGTNDSNVTLNFFWRRFMFGWFLKEAFLDHEKQEEIVRASDLDWTIVRPGAFTDGPKTNSYRHGSVSQNMNLKLKISRADVASFLLQQVEDYEYLRQSPILSY